MKNYIYISFLLVVLLLSFNKFNRSTNVPRGIAEAIKRSDSQDLVFYFNQTVNLTIERTSGTYNKQQAEILIHNFFQKNQTVEFSVLEEKNYSNFSYAIYKITTNKRKVFTIYTVLHTLNDTQLVTEMKILPLEN